MSFPLQKTLAFRVGIGGISSRGTSTVPNEDTIFLRHSMFNLSGEFQIFFDDAYRHRGAYAIAGLSGNFERFERSYDDNWNAYRDYSEVNVTRKSRLGGIIGMGHTFYGAAAKFTTEIAYHATLTGKDLNLDDPIESNFVRISFGLVF